MDEEPKNALWRRQEQLRRWNISDTNRESAEPKTLVNLKVKFQDGCVFLAACAAGDTDEVERLLKNGSDVNTANIDGLTALHQACIDDVIDIVKFLVERGADPNACDNEGWTALHVAASCATPETAKYLIDAGADIRAVNNDGDLAVDLAESEEMEQLIRQEMAKQNIDEDSARNEEEQVMLRDAQQWLNAGNYREEPHPISGATALHVAAAKGYINVMTILLQITGIDIDCKDCDGWTPLHAAAHWAQAESCKLLVENFCNLDAKNNAGQTAFDICDPEILTVLEDLKERQVTLNAERIMRPKNLKDGQLKRRSSIPRISVDQKSRVSNLDALDEKDRVAEMLSKGGDAKKESEDDVSPESANQSPDEESDTERQNKINSKKSQESLPPAPRPERNEPKEMDAKVSDNSESTAVHKTSIEANGDIPSVPPEAPQIEDVVKKDEIQPPPPVAPPPAPPDEKSESEEEESESEEDSDSEESDESEDEEEIKEVKTQEERDYEARKKAEDERKRKEAERILAEQSKHMEEHLRRMEEQKKQEEEEERQEAELKRQWELKRLRDLQELSREAAAAMKQAEKRESGDKDFKQGEPHAKEPRTDGHETSGFSRAPLGRTYSLPCKVGSGPLATSHSQLSSSATGRSQVPGSVLRPGGSSGLTRPVSERIEPMGGGWRTGLRKTGSSSAVPDAHSSASVGSSGKDKVSAGSGGVAKSASSPWIPGEKHDHSRTRICSASGMGDSASKHYRGVGDASTITSTRPTSSIAALGSGSSSYSSTSPTSSSSGSTNRRSFEPPKRDEEKEVERKARAKRARETRRSTQGVTKEDLHRAEESLKSASKGESRLDSSSNRDDDKSDKENKPDDLSSIRRKTGDDSEDISSLRKSRDSGISTETSSNSSYNLRNNNKSATTTSTTATTTSSLSSISGGDNSSSAAARTSYRSPYSSSSNKDNEQDVSSRLLDVTDALQTCSISKEEREDPSQKSAAIKARRKREHRKPTGKVSPEELQAAREEFEGNVESPTEKKEDELSTASSRYSSRYSDPSGSLYTGDYSKYSSSSRASDRPSSYSPAPYSRSNTSVSIGSIGSDVAASSTKEIDYKRLYEQEKSENEKLKKEVEKLRQELNETKLDLEKAKLKNETKSYDARIDSRIDDRKVSQTLEKRALERKISELEEEMKAMENLKADNARLKEENGALIRVISKLSK